MLGAGAPRAAALLRDGCVRGAMLALRLAGWAVVLRESLRPLDSLPLGHPDTALHLAGYAGIAALAAGFCQAPRPFLVLAGSTAAAGGLIEAAQAFLSHRSFDPLNLAANAAGAALGGLAALAWVELASLRPRPVTPRRGPS